MLKSQIFTVVALLLTSFEAYSSAVCPFHYTSMNSLANLGFTEVSKTSGLDIPTEFSSFADLKSFDFNACSGALVEKTYISEASFERLSLIYTNADRCDGGNSYGLVLEGNKVIAKIIDSDIVCL